MSGWLFDNAGGRANRDYNPRPYQRAAVGAVNGKWEESSEPTTAFAIMACGTGKTEVATELIRKRSTEGKGSLLCVPYIDLCHQTAGRLRSRGVACGIEQGVLRSDHDVTVACYASLLSRNRWQEYVGRIKTCIVDEVHLNYTPSAMRMLSAFMEAGANILGMTATPQRAGGDPLTKFYGPPTFRYEYPAAAGDGWLVPLKVWLTVLQDLDLSAFKRRHGDFDAEELGRIMAQEKQVQAIGSMIEQYHEGKPSIVFCQSIRQTEQLLRDLARRGIYASMVHSKMDEMERRMHLKDFEQGNTTVICNVGCLVAGWDYPAAEKCFIAKPTVSPAKYTQMAGRVFRPLPQVVEGYATAAERKEAIAESGKPCGEIYDITDSSRYCDLRSAVDLLLPDEDENVRKRVRQRLERASQPTEIDPILEEERAAAAREQAARDLLTEKLRAGLIARAKFTLVERDPLAAAEQPPVIGKRPPNYKFWPFGKYKGKQYREIPSWYLRFHLDKGTLNDNLREIVTRELSKRDN
jgi:superfamily II DNA or RNA helicase